MTIGGAIAIILVVAFLVAIFYMFFGLDRMLKSSLRSALQAGESVSFESPSNRGGGGFGVMFSFRQGYLVITNLRLLMAWWVVPPIWRTVEVIPIRDIDKASTLNMLGMNQVLLTVRGKKLMISPYKNRMWPFLGDKGEELITALQSSSEARFTTHKSTGFKDYIRSQIEPKQ
jgi:hypothetical protein